MKKLILLLCLMPLVAFGQNNLSRHTDVLEHDSSSVQTKINSLNAILSRETKGLHDTIVVDFYLQLAGLHSSNKDFQAAVMYCDTILNKFKNLDFQKTMDVKIQRAMFFKRGGKMEETVKGLLEVLSSYEDNGDFAGSAKMNKDIGVIFLRIGDLKSAEYHLKESIEHARKVGDFVTEGYSLMSLGNRFKKENDFDNAEKNYLKSIEIAEREDIKRLLAGNYNNYGSLFRINKKLSQAMKYYKKAVKMNQEIGNDKWLSYNYNNIGNLYNDQKKYAEALRYFTLSTEIKDRMSDLRGKVQTMSSIASAHFALGNYQEAYKFQKKYATLSDSVAKLDNADLMKTLGAQFQAEKRETEIIRLNLQDKLNKKDLKAADERISYQSWISWLMGIGIALIFIIAIFLWRSAVNRKKINSELMSKNAKIDAQHNEIIDSINYAKRIQNSILPGSERLKSLLDKYAVLYRPKDIISGDFYICDSTSDGVYFGTVDCTGHGVPGAMVSLVASSHFNKMLHELQLKEPGAILNQLNKEVPDALAVENEVINDGMDMALCFMNEERTVLKFSGAYQNCWVLNDSKVNKDRKIVGNSVLHEGVNWSIIELKGDRQGIGKTTTDKRFSTQELKLEKGDKIFLSTDGYQDQFGGPNNKKFKVKEMRRLVLENGGKTPDSLIEILEKAMKGWQGDNDQVDDICVMVVEV